MEEKHSYSQQSTEFTCPNCESVAFEIIRRERVQDDAGTNRQFLVIRCLNCFQFFNHELVTSDSHTLTGGTA